MIAHLDSINRIHDRMLLKPHQSAIFLTMFALCRKGKLTAIPAKAPAVMFCSKEKFGGSAS